MISEKFAGGSAQNTHLNTSQSGQTAGKNFHKGQMTQMSLATAHGSSQEVISHPAISS